MPITLIMKVILFGSTGMLGSYVLNTLKEDYKMVVINRDNYDIVCDEWSKLEYLIKTNIKENDIIINCAGIIPQKYNDESIGLYVKVNTLFPHKLNEISKKYNMRFVHITTDCVYDGYKGNYIVSDCHSTTKIYGISKSLGEPTESTIIRTSIIGEELLGKNSFIEWVKKNKMRELNGYTNHHWNGVTCYTLSKIIKQMLDESIFWEGIKHIHSPDIVTKYDLFCYINEIYDLSINVIPFEDKISKNMTLYDPEPLFKIDNIYNQITEQKNQFANSLFESKV
jgi:dTDP-4-dehydrorhamnose reductase